LAERKGWVGRYGSGTKRFKRSYVKKVVGEDVYWNMRKRLLKFGAMSESALPFLDRDKLEMYSK